MSDNAEILRELIHWCPDVVGTHPTRKEDAYRALDALVAEVKRLRKTLAFYAEPIHSIDDGKRARAALDGEQP